MTEDRRDVALRNFRTVVEALRVNSAFKGRVLQASDNFLDADFPSKHPPTVEGKEAALVAWAELQRDGWVK